VHSWQKTTYDSGLTTSVYVQLVSGVRSAAARQARASITISVNAMPALWSFAHVKRRA
jgi:hypothetical protein